MKPIKLSLTIKIEGVPDWVELSPNGHWLAVRFGVTWQIWDNVSGTCIRTFTLDVYWAIISLDGTQVAARTNANEITIVDSVGTRKSRTVPFTIIDFIFTANGNYLWMLLNDATGKGNITLVDTKTLEIVSLHSAALNMGNHTDLAPRWYETEIILHPSTETIAIVHTAGDTYIETLFFRNDGTAIQKLPYAIEADSPPRFACFSSSGEAIIAVYGNELAFWQFAATPNSLDMPVLREGDPLDNTKYVHHVGFINEQPLVAIGDNDDIKELRLFESLSENGAALIEILLPRDLQLSGPFAAICTMKGNVVVGYGDGELLVYHANITT